MYGIYPSWKLNLIKMLLTFSFVLKLLERFRDGRMRTEFFIWRQLYRWMLWNGRRQTRNCWLGWFETNFFENFRENSFWAWLAGKSARFSAIWDPSGYVLPMPNYFGSIKTDETEEKKPGCLFEWLPLDMKADFVKNQRYLFRNLPIDCMLPR